MRERQRLEEMRIVIEQGKLRPLVDQVLPLEQVAKRTSDWTPDMAAARSCFGSSERIRIRRHHCSGDPVGK
jgi:hypothetical protein